MASSQVIGLMNVFIDKHGEKLMIIYVRYLWFINDKVSTNVKHNHYNEIYICGGS